ncbi:putative nlpBDapX lipoprotein [Burkholderia pseudomallei]|uniref:hypothetical protein n=1 Tax=Burkholderia pseudomallei TaxID=28450 RepID=UPI00097552C5|nr:hypothetical protein [Burkholderia pseudomallei]OMR41328.1 hypothetical protein AQ724_10735 [Burkholderia pseudomallei]CAJ4916742.1 putative nlpBDapX lipoprotein [Burkholderia pseudomallei]CAJ6031700.1 putative nlpBDapX lipoprotein [Burkholderia pseudomallei]CAJ6658296.1 putative nlpBDapX lipoprotein [Burkholderia pseudomallei]CAJ6684384.1 putative nlpBDapX lipoprotein [Burkholderia pseudomallei]
MKPTDLHAEARRNWLRDEQAPRVTPSEPARQSNLEKSLLFKCVFAAALIIAANVLDSGPVADKPATFHANV